MGFLSRTASASIRITTALFPRRNSVVLLLARICECQPLFRWYGKQIFIGSQHKGRGNRVQFIETLLTQLAGAFDVITADVYWGLNVIRCWFSTADAEFYFHFYVQILSGFTSRISLGGICTPFFNKRIFSLDPFNASL